MTQRVVVVGGLHPEGAPNERMGTKDRWYAHSICGSTYGIAAALSQHGFDAYPFKGFRDREPFDTADVLFVSEWNLAEYVEENGLWDFAKKPAVLLLHSDSPGRRHSRSELLEMYRGICFTRREAMDAFLGQVAEWIKEHVRASSPQVHELAGRRGWHLPPGVPERGMEQFLREAVEKAHEPGSGFWVAEWGFPDWWTFPPEQPNPYAPGTKNIVYAGRLTATHRVYHWIKEVAHAFRYATVWVIANVEPGHEVIEHDLAQIPNVRFLGRMPHGTFQHYLYYADVALDSGTAGEARLVNNCKLWDYLACGVPVVLDGATGGDELVKATGLGCIVPKDDDLEYRAAVEWYLNDPETRVMRDGAIRFMKDNHTWSATVARWVEDFRKVVST